MQRAPLSPSFFQSSITRRLRRAERLYIPASVGTSPRYPADPRLIFPTEKLTRGPATAGPFFMPLQRLTAYPVGRFLLSILATSATAAPRERLLSARRLCSRYGDRPYWETPAPGIYAPRYGRFNGVLRPVFTPVALLHRQRFYARFWGIVEPCTGISDAARER